MAKITLTKKCPDENVFWLCNGMTLATMKELISALEEMDSGVFSYHVNSEKNDFANWIKDIFRDIELAESLMNVMEKQAYLEIIKARAKPAKKPKKAKQKKKK